MQQGNTHLVSSRLFSLPRTKRNQESLFDVWTKETPLKDMLTLSGGDAPTRAKEKHRAESGGRGGDGGGEVELGKR